MLATVLTTVQIAYVVILAAWILLEKRPPLATLAWIFGLAAVPIGGFVVYFFLGHRRVKKNRLKRLRARLGVRDAKDAMAGAGAAAVVALHDARARQLMQLATHVAGSPPSTCRSLRVLENGAATFDAIEAAITGAKHHVHLEYYIFEPDRAGTRMRDVLVERARAGVEVRLLVDGVGSHRLSRGFLRPLRDAGAQVARFGAVTLARVSPRLVNFRTHRKIAVCDGTVGFVGGINVTDDEDERVRGANALRDTHLEMTGPAVRWLQLVFLEDWHYATGHAPTTPKYFPECEENGTRAVQILASGPDHDLEAIKKLYFAAIASARERVLITTPYFVPDEAMLEAISTAALRGVDVRLLVPKRSDSRLVTAAGRSYYDELVAVGVRVFEYGPAMVHAKTLVVDEAFAAVGSANMDGRSFRLNFEVAAIAYDAALASELAASFERDLEHAREVRRDRSARAPLARRLGEAGARLLSPIL